MNEWIESLLREQKPRYVLIDGDWLCVQMDRYKAFRVRAPRVWPASKPRPSLRVIDGGRK